MIHYKLTCIKDMPDVEKGFSYSFDEHGLNYEGAMSFSRNLDKDKKMREAIKVLAPQESEDKEYDLD